MKKTYIYIIISAYLLMVAGCAKQAVVGPNDAAKRYIDAWIELYNKENKTDIKPSGLGIYVLDSTETTSETVVTDNGFAIVDYTITDLKGNILETSLAEKAKQLGLYDSTYYFGPEVWLTMDATIQAGLQDALVGMKVGEYKKVMIPSWLMTYSTYSTPGEYLNQSSEYTHTIYEFTVKDYTDSINVWQIDSIKRYINNKYEGGVESFKNDTTGFYYKQLKAPVSDKAFPSDTTIYINYTGRLLNGLIFDTTDERTAKDHGIYNSSRTYGPTEVNWAESYSEITLGSSSVIEGFARTLWSMKAMEKGVGIFYSPLGYSYSGSGESIPGYAPLIFEIEIVAEPED